MDQSRMLRGNRVLRYTLEERIVHWVSGASYIYLLLSGLALWSPSMWWLIVILGGGPLTRWVHPLVGIVFVASVFYMYRMWKPDMEITATDKAWGKEIGRYVRNEEEELEPVHAIRS